ncbi:putative ABC transport system permease protein [Pseudobutyrivibrio sp. UC1225]|uniref:ABC transporter permease n=1 Tax=Pseudobutyrivibrio sp. UC1225 TaxID=1798185 RepID=UPI0008F3CF43|nr:ABC transporter permease [Pseudobutyrivibrio sp. UC1225]SFN66322.1 putative ABC transport system permease protein [Pseudobutyrivibrio sp. UC1225]
MLVENCKLAIKSIKANKKRAFLTMLGIIIGVAAVIAIMTVGNSMTKGVQKQLESYGVQNIEVYISTIDYSQELSEEEQENLKFKPEDIHSLSEHFGKKIAAISMDSSLGNGTVLVNNKKAKVDVTGVSAGYFKANNLKLKSGSYFNEYAYRQGTNVALVSEKYAKQIAGENYKNEDVIGKTYEVNLNDEYINLTVVGIYEEQKSQGMGGSAAGVQTTTMYIPLFTAWNFNHNKDMYSPTVVAAEGVDTIALSNDIKAYLNQKMANQLGDKLQIDAYSNQSMIQENNKMMNQLTMAISLIAAIALIVGGIGVMNIMTVSITERTREIGTRKALGAEDSMIMLQFISEAVILCLIGGLIGMVIGVVIGDVASKLMGYAPTISLASIYISVGFSTAIGMFFGYSPAKHAAKMNPIDALRYE